MECSKVRDRLAGYLQDDLRLTERLIVEVHVAHCPGCRADMHEIRDILRVCEDALRHPNPANDYASLRAQLAEADRAAIVPLREQLRPRKLTAAAGIAAACAIIVGASSPFLAHYSWFVPLQEAVDEAVIEDMSTVVRESDARGWRPAEELLGKDTHRDAPSAPLFAAPAAYAPAP